ncbi:MAG: hypothetical protein RXO36_08240 [Candidatus Nanopusillus acidilobi]
MQTQDKEYFKELSKDVGLFIAGIFAGPIIDLSLLMKKHAPVLHKKISSKINKKIKFLEEVK